LAGGNHLMQGLFAAEGKCGVYQPANAALRLG
jgi:hypothetical protein